MLRPASFPQLETPSGDVDVAIVGAGAAGIGAARACREAGLRVAVLEARDRVGGRAVTVSFAGHPVDLGAHWLHAGNLNPLVRLARKRGERLRRMAGDGPVVVDGRVQPRSARRSYGQAFERADLAFARAARGRSDQPISTAMPPLGRWGAGIASTMALISGRPLAEVSVQDFPSEEFGDNYFVRGGYGAYLARLAIGLPIRLNCPVRTIDWSGRDVKLETSAGRITAHAAIVATPIPIIADGAIRFAPGLPDGVSDAIAGYLPGAYDHAILNWTGSPFRKPDRLTKLIGRSGAYGMLTGMDGAPFHYLEFDYATMAGTRGAAERARLARAILQDTFGARAVRGLRVLATTDWLNDPFARAAWSVVAPGRAADRIALGRPVGNRIWFAGEAVSRRMWGTVGGAWEEGERAAREVAAHLAARPTA